MLKKPTYDFKADTSQISCPKIHAVDEGEWYMHRGNEETQELTVAIVDLVDSGESSQVGHEEEIIEQLNRAGLMCSFENRLSFNIILMMVIMPMFMLFRRSLIAMSFPYRVVRMLK